MVCLLCKYRLSCSGLVEAGGPGHCHALMRERHQDIHVVDGEEARLAVCHAFVPVVVDLIGQGDDVALFEAQLALVLRLEVVERSAAGLVHGDCEGHRDKRGGHPEAQRLSVCTITRKLRNYVHVTLWRTTNEPMRLETRSAAQFPPPHLPGDLPGDLAEWTPPLWP